MNFRISTLLIFFSLSVSPHGLHAQAQASAHQVTLDLKVANDAVKLRSDMVGNILNGSEKADVALRRLKAQSSPSGIKFASEANLAFAAIDVGRRLIAVGKPADAETFFLAAEASLAVAVRKPNLPVSDKARFLRELSLIRAKYLNEVVQARADIEEAITLQPDDKDLQHTEDTIASGHAEHFKDKRVH